MPRVRSNVARLKRKKQIMKAARGNFGGRSKLWKAAKETVERGWVYAYRDRKNKKREFRKLWILRINAAAHQHDMSYSVFMNGLKKAGVEIDRKILADLAVKDADAFAALAEKAKLGADGCVTATAGPADGRRLANAVRSSISRLRVPTLTLEEFTQACEAPRRGRSGADRRSDRPRRVGRLAQRARGPHQRPAHRHHERARLAAEGRPARRGAARERHQGRDRGTARAAPRGTRRRRQGRRARRSHDARARALARLGASGLARDRRDQRDLSASSASRLRSGPRPRRSGTTSSRSTSPRTIPRWSCTTRSTSRAAGCCARTPRRCRSARCSSIRRRSGSSRRATCIAAISSTRRTRRCSRRSRGSPWTRGSASATSRRR